jgi:hypothetical protein
MPPLLPTSSAIIESRRSSTFFFRSFVLAFNSLTLSTDSYGVKQSQIPSHAQMISSVSDVRSLTVTSGYAVMIWSLGSFFISL